MKITPKIHPGNGANSNKIRFENGEMNSPRIIDHVKEKANFYLLHYLRRYP